ncbi:MAG TPA: PQQ-dependent dehydrogenase, methanol/ethanol family [Gemmatimonadaceae bacterium]|nr:PQQ-dependent dehydrogenase, methanol/ethanol family [Gemmatimonadaceae bacterium]
MTRLVRALAFGIACHAAASPFSRAHAQRAVDAAAIRSAAPDEWLTYGRDYAETHYSPLAQITRDNVSKLKLAWSSAIDGTAGALEATPVVSNGVLYATSTWSVVFALDARTGTLKWRWDPQITQGGLPAGGPTPCCGSVNRGVAIYQGKVYAGLLDGRLVALDAETGRVVWSKQTTPPNSNYTITGAPRVIKGKVIIGNAGADLGVRGYVTAYDAQAGEQAWRFYTVPGDPSKPFESRAMQTAAATWKGEWWKHGGGGTVWDAMAFDPEADLLYIGVGNGAPWSRDHRSPGGGDNLFLSSIVALRPDSGTYVWHYQTTPGDDWDYTATQPIILADLTIEGRARKVLMQAPKNGFFYVIDRLTGEFISAEAYTPVSWATGIDRKTGRPIEAANARYGATGAWLAPATPGAHNWHPMSWNPNTGLVYIPGQNMMQFFRTAATFEPRPGQFNTGLSGTGATPRPDPLGPPGFLVAWDPVAQRERWRIALNSRFNGGTLTTAGNVVFSGAANLLLAHDATTGEKLWEMQLAPGLATPVTFRLDGKQYVTVLAGRPGVDARVWTFVLE